MIVDNNIVTFGGQFDNAIYAPSFIGAASDNELPTLLNFLLLIAHVDDVRPYVKQFSGLLNLYQLFLAMQPEEPERPSLSSLSRTLDP